MRKFCVVLSARTLHRWRDHRNAVHRDNDRHRTFKNGMCWKRSSSFSSESHPLPLSTVTDHSYGAIHSSIMIHREWKAHCARHGMLVIDMMCLGQDAVISILLTLRSDLLRLRGHGKHCFLCLMFISLGHGSLHVDYTESAIYGAIHQYDDRECSVRSPFTFSSTRCR